MPYRVIDPDDRVFREEACCGSCDAGFACECEDEPAHQEDQILRDEEASGLTPEELRAGRAQFDAWFPAPILTRPGESLIDTVREAREADEKEGKFEAYNNDMK